MPRKLDNADEIMKLYASGVSSTELAKTYGLNRTTIPKMYKRINNISSMLPNQGNIRYFQTIDSEIKAYLLGFIAADGCVGDNNCFKINIVNDDRMVLEKLKQEIGAENKISYVIKKKGRPQVSFGLINKLFCDDLRQYGIIPRKSLTMTNIIENIPKTYRPSFILGYLDGDGWCSNSQVHGKYKLKKVTYIKTHMICHVGFCGTKDFLVGLTDEINPNVFRIKESKSIHVLELGSSKSEIIRYYHYLYDNQPFFLQRKHDKFIEYFETINYNPFNQVRTISSSI